MKKMFLASMFVLLASCVNAQTRFVNVNGATVPCDHPIAIRAGQGCVATSPTPGTVGNTCETFGRATVCSMDECRRINPYENGDHAVACVQLSGRIFPPVPPVQKVFRVGQTYTAPYPSHQMRVLAITRSTIGTELVVCEWVRPNAGQVFVIMNLPNVTEMPEGSWLMPHFWQDQQ